MSQDFLSYIQVLRIYKSIVVFKENGFPILLFKYMYKSFET